MYNFTPETIRKAYSQLHDLPSQVGGIICVKSVIPTNVQELVSYEINSEILKKQLSFVFDKTYTNSFGPSSNKYIIFAKNWVNTFFSEFIKKKINILACSIFFLRRQSFEGKPTEADLIDSFLKKFNMVDLKDSWFIEKNEINLLYNEDNCQENQAIFYHLYFSETDFRSITFNDTLKKNAYEFSAAAHIQTLYSGNEIKKYFIYSDEALSNFYQFNKAEQNHSSNNKLKQDQSIYYGVPGSGKSYKIDDQLKTHFGFIKEQIETNTMRVVFHPEYTNADFVGQVMPVISDSSTDTKVTYKFTPGPFAKILRKAYQHPDEKYCLIIEEINRGNAAAIFGDIFQLLDRLGEGEEESTVYTKGWSKYFISNDYLNWYIRENVYDKVTQPNDKGVAIESENNEDKNQKSIEINSIHFSCNTGIRLPPNLSLLATMNTSDQNVFTLDNAFQRRWDMQLIENNFEDNKDETKEQKELKHIQRDAIITTKTFEATWENFHQAINSLISEKSNEANLSSMEDKRIGCWFVKAEKVEDKNKININTFKNKVLKYLWDDAFKFCRQEVFEKEIDSFEKLQESFDQEGFDVISDFKTRLSKYKKDHSPNTDTENAGNTG